MFPWQSLYVAQKVVGIHGSKSKCEGKSVVVKANHNCVLVVIGDKIEIVPERQ